jgi:uncharacterized protein (DUF433 family)
MSIEIGSVLTRSPEIRNGRPCIAGTRFTVHNVAIYYKMGYTAEEITREYPHLPPAGIYAALAYYHANQNEIEADIAADEEAGDHLEAQFLRLKEERQVA